MLQSVRSTFFAQMTRVLLVGAGILALTAVSTDALVEFLPEQVVRKESLEEGGGRLLAWEHAVDQIKSRPWLGSGGGAEERSPAASLAFWLASQSSDTLATSLVSLWTGDKVGAADALLAAEPADALSRGNDPSSRSTSLKTFTFVTAAATAATEPLLPGDGDRLFLIIAAGKRLPRHPLVLRPLSFVGCADFRSLKTPPKNTEPRVARPRPCFADGSPKADAPSTSEPRQW